MSEQKVLATVAGETITEQDFTAFLASLPADQQRYANHPNYREHYLEQMVNIMLYAEYAKELKLDETEEYQKMLAKAKRDILAQMSMTMTVNSVAVSDEEAEAFYKANEAQFVKEPKAKARHILVETEEKCKEVLETILKGEKTFEDAAAEVSTCPSASVGGDLGSFGRGQMVKEFEDAVFSAEVGKVYGPVQTQFGFHLIKVEEKTEASLAPFEEVKSIIVKNLGQQKQGEAYNKKVEELKEKYLG